MFWQGHKHPVNIAKKRKNTPVVAFNREQVYIPKTLWRTRIKRATMSFEELREEFMKIKEEAEDLKLIGELKPDRELRLKNPQNLNPDPENMGPKGRIYFAELRDIIRRLSVEGQEKLYGFLTAEWYGRKPGPDMKKIIEKDWYLKL